jgi:hypothetical protein
LQIYEAGHYEAVGIFVDLVGFDQLVAHLRDAAPLDEDRTLRPNFVVRDDAAPKCYGPHDIAPLFANARRAAGRAFGELFDPGVGADIGDA